MGHGKVFAQIVNGWIDGAGVLSLKIEVTKINMSENRTMVALIGKVHEFYVVTT